MSTSRKLYFPNLSIISFNVALNHYKVDKPILMLYPDLETPRSSDLPVSEICEAKLDKMLKPASLKSKPCEQSFEDISDLKEIREQDMLR